MEIKNEIEIKRIQFMGAELMAARDEKGQIWAGVKWVCNGIGLSRGQANGEIVKVQTDETLAEGCTKFHAGVFDPYHETIALKLDFVPLWLAKISITPAMKEERPELAAALKEYQLRAKDVLAEAFLPPDTIPDLATLSPELQMFKAIFDSVAKTELEQKEQAKAIAAVNQRVDDIREVVALNPIQWRKESLAIIDTIAKQLGGMEHIRDLHAEIYKLVDARAGCNLTRRLENLKCRMMMEGRGKSKIKEANKLDVIGQDKKLIEIYVAVVKEMAVKYGAIGGLKKEEHHV